MKTKYRGALSATYGAMLFEGGLLTIIISLMVFFTERYGLPREQVALLVTAKGVGTLLSNYFGGKLSDRYGRRKVIMTGILLFLVWMVGFLITSNYYLAMFFAFVGGVGHGLTDSPSISVIFDAINGNTGPAMSLVQVFFAGGGMITSFIASLLIKNSWNWQILFYIYIVILLIVLYLVYSSKYPRLAAEKEESQYHVVYKHEPSIKREGAILCAIALVFALAYGIVLNWLPSFAEDIKHFSSDEAVGLLTYFQLGAVLGSFLFMGILKKVHTTVPMIWNAVLGFLFLGALVYVQDLLLARLLAMAMGVVMGIYFSLTLNMGGELFLSRAGEITGLLGTLNLVGNMILGSILGLLVPHTGITFLFYFAIFCMGLLVVLAWVFRKRVQELQPSYR